MPEFTPITTQEDFDARIASRLERERNKVRNEEFSDYGALQRSVETLTTQLNDERAKTAGYEAEISELSTKVQTYETDSVKTRIALEVGLPIEMRTRLTGTTEEEIRADAESLLKFVGASLPANAEPPYSPEGEIIASNEQAAAMRTLVQQLS